MTTLRVDPSDKQKSAQVIQFPGNYYPSGTTPKEKNTKAYRQWALGAAAVALVVVGLTLPKAFEKKPVVNDIANDLMHGRPVNEQLLKNVSLVGDMERYNGVIELKAGVIIRSTPRVLQGEDSNIMGYASKDPDNPTTAFNSLIVDDTNNPSNGKLYSVEYDDKVGWVNWQNIVQIDEENISPAFEDLQNSVGQ